MIKPFFECEKTFEKTLEKVLTKTKK